MEKFDPHSNAWLLNKFKFYSELRNADQLYWSKKYNLYCITRYDDVVFALNSPETFSSSNGNLIREFPSRIGHTLASTDNPKHNMLKDVIKNAYSKANIDRVSGCIKLKVEELLVNKQRLDLSALTLEVGAWLTVEILNIPYDKVAMKDLILDMLAKSDKSISKEFYKTDESSLIKFAGIVKDLLQRRVEPLGPGLYAEFFENGDLDKHGLFFFTAAVFPGVTSTAGALQQLVLDLGEYPEAQRAVRNNPELAENAVDESSRYYTSTSRFLRTVVKEVTIQNTLLPVGTRVALCLDSANRDPAKWENADSFDLTRNTAKCVSFGYGVHTCIAQSVTRQAMIEFIRVFLSQFNDYRIVTKREDYVFLMTAPGNFDLITNLEVEKVLGD
jgi:cytochrome P450